MKERGMNYTMKKIITITLALLILLSCIPLSVAAAPKVFFDDCKSYDTLFEKSSNFDDRGGGWEYDEDGKSNRWNPHPTLGLTCFGKKAGYREWVTYKFEKATSFELHFYCAYDDKGTYLIKPIYEYEDQPLLAGAIVEVSTDNKTWTKIKLNESEGKQAGNKDPDNGYYWVDYTVTPAEKLPENSYFRITLGQTAGWSMFLGSVKLTDDPAAAPAAVVTTVPTPVTEPTTDTASDTTVEAADDTTAATGDDTDTPAAVTTTELTGVAEPDAETTVLSVIILVLIIVPVVAVIAVVIIVIVVVSKKKKAVKPSDE